MMRLLIVLFHRHSALIVQQAQMTSPPCEAKELWITHNHMHPQHSVCELLHMYLFLPETDCFPFRNYDSNPSPQLSNSLISTHGTSEPRMNSLLKGSIDWSVECKEDKLPVTLYKHNQSSSRMENITTS